MKALILTSICVFSLSAAAAPEPVFDFKDTTTWESQECREEGCVFRNLLTGERFLHKIGGDVESLSVENPFFLPKPVAALPVNHERKQQSVPWMLQGIRDIQKMPEGSVVVVDWFKDGCPGCEALEPQLRELESEKGFTLARIDTSRAQAAAKYLKLNALPSVYVYRKSGTGWDLHTSFVGNKAKDALRRAIPSVR